MKVMVMIKGPGAEEGKAAPTQEMFEQMGAYNEKLVEAGIMLDGEGLLPSARGAKVVFEGGTTTVQDGPFTEAKELIGGFWMWEVSSLEEAIEWAKRCPADPNFGSRQVLEIRPVFGPEDFPAEFSPELREAEQKLAERIREQHPTA